VLPFDLKISVRVNRCIVCMKSDPPRQSTRCGRWVKTPHSRPQSRSTANPTATPAAAGRLGRHHAQGPRNDRRRRYASPLPWAADIATDLGSLPGICPSAELWLSSEEYIAGIALGVSVAAAGLLLLCPLPSPNDPAADFAAAPTAPTASPTS